MSIVSHKHKFVFLKTRKTAGTSISAVLAGLCDYEDILALSKDVMVSSDLKRTNIKIPVRNIPPLLLAKHLFRTLIDSLDLIRGRKKIGDIELLPTFKQHMIAKDLKQILGPKIWNNYYKFTIERNPFDRLVSFYNWRSHRFNVKCEFDEFALSALKNTGKYKHIASGFSNVPFYSLDNKTLCLDNVMKFENLEVDFKKALIDIGISNFDDLSLPKYKSGIRTEFSYREFYNTSLKELAEDKFKTEANLFGYKF